MADLHRSDLNPDAALDLMSSFTCSFSLDVRSEKEFRQGELPQSKNVPILVDEHRHLVGIAYKKEGPQAAIHLANQLVQPHREGMVKAWASHLESLPADQRLLFCWRGGLRSQTAKEWLQAHGIESRKVKGGYKAMRNLLLEQFNALPAISIISGLTGCGKTELLYALDSALDLEGYAEHRGSAFGGYFQAQQPAQQTFENQIAFRLREKLQHYFLEDESRLIGRCAIPQNLYQAMMGANCIVLEASVSERVERIYNDYVLEGKRRGVLEADYLNYFRRCLWTLRSRLGGLATGQITSLMEDAFSGGYDDEERHHRWIQKILVEYYDRKYVHACSRLSRKVIFQGDVQECIQWIKESYPSG